jgi:hypothetical protein
LFSLINAIILNVFTFITKDVQNDGPLLVGKLYLPLIYFEIVVEALSWKKFETAFEYFSSVLLPFVGYWHKLCLSACPQVKITLV